MAGNTDIEKTKTTDTDNGHRDIHLGQVDTLASLGYQPSHLLQNRSMLTLLFQSLAISAIPFGVGGPLISAIYGDGQLELFIGWIIVVLLGQCVALSISELASRYPTSAGPYYWSFQLASKGKTVLSFVIGCIWLIGNWTIALSVNYGFAVLTAATISMYKPEWQATSWQLLLILYALLLVTLLVCTWGNRWLPKVDTACAGWTGLTILIIMISLSVKAKAGRHDVKYALTNFDTSFSGWGSFSFFIGLLPGAYVYSAIGMISAMAEKCEQPAVKVPRAISFAVNVEGLAGLLFILPICFTMPPLEEVITAPYGQALPVIFLSVMGSRGGALGLLLLVLVLTMCCSLSITTAASRCTWAFARDDAILLSRLWSRVDDKLGVPKWALVLVTILQMLLGLINLGSSSAFTAFVSVGVMGLEVSYFVPIAVSLWHGPKEVNAAPFNCGRILGTTVNFVAVVWILFQVVLFSMPTALPVTEVTMNYASVVFCGFAAISAVWYIINARKGNKKYSEHNPIHRLTCPPVYKGPPESDGIRA